MVSFDFVSRFAPKLSDAARVRLGRGIMVTVLVLCAVLAPSIRQFKSVFGYLVQLWSLLAPPVFVCVVAGIFTRRASARGATATLATGVTLGAITFWALRMPDVTARLPVYLRSALNCGFVITVICAAVMTVVSFSNKADDHAGEVEAVRTAAGPGMTPAERFRYLLTLAALAVLWLTILFLFSPWGLATSRAAA
jgi:SSS family solute:Na+ symporter